MPRSAAISSAATSTPKQRPKPIAQPGRDVRQRRGQRHLEEQARAPDVHGAGGAQQHRRHAAHAAPGRGEDREERAEQDHEHLRALAEAEPDDGERDPGQRRDRPQQLDERPDQARRPIRPADAARPGSPRRGADREAGEDAAEADGDVGAELRWREVVPGDHQRLGGSRQRLRVAPAEPRTEFPAPSTRTARRARRPSDRRGRGAVIRRAPRGGPARAAAGAPGAPAAARDEGR